MRISSFIKANWFVIALFVIPLLAWPWPELGSYNGILHASAINKIAVVIIFFMNGITLNRDVLFGAFRKLKVLAAIQFFCFIIAPAIAYAANASLFKWMDFRESFITGTLILACLPTTIASCAIFTKMTGGDAAASLFNAMISNFIGVIFAPVALSYLLALNGESLHFSAGPIILNLFYLIVIPLIFGQLTHHYWEGAEKLKPRFKAVNQWLLLFIVYSAFCNSFLEARNTLLPWSEVLMLVIGMALLNGVYIGLSYVLGKAGNFVREDRIAILFTAPQKTIAVGIPLSIALIEASAGYNGTQGLGGLGGLGFTLLPLLIFNNIQWLSAGVLQAVLRK